MAILSVPSSPPLPEYYCKVFRLTGCTRPWVYLLVMAGRIDFLVVLDLAFDGVFFFIQYALLRLRDMPALLVSIILLLTANRFFLPFEPGRLLIGDLLLAFQVVCATSQALVAPNNLGSTGMVLGKTGVRVGRMCFCGTRTMSLGLRASGHTEERQCQCQRGDKLFQV